MFNFGRNVGGYEPINESDYSIENNGHLLAIQEAFEDLAEINASVAEMNDRCVDAYGTARFEQGQTASMATATMESAMAPVMEGFFGDMKDKLISMLKKLKEKIIAFFKSALKYFNALFMNARNFAEKYEDELNEKSNELDGLKVEMYDYANLKSYGNNVLKTIGNTLGEYKKQDGSLMDDKAEAVGKKIAAAQGRTGVEKEAAGKKEYLKTVREDILKGCRVSGAISNEKMHEAIRIHLRGDKTSPKMVEVNVSKLISELKDDDVTDVCESVRDEVTGQLDNLIDDLNKLKDKASDNLKNSNDANRSNHQEALRVAKFNVSCFTEAKSIVMGAFDVYKSVVKERDSAYKSALSKALHYKKKKD